MSSARPTGKRIALVLGAGGARGLAHIGAIETLEARGYEIVAIAGSSMGAVIGGIHAAGRLKDYRDWVVTLERGDVLRLLDFGFGRPGLFTGDRLMGVLRELIGEHQIENLPIPFTAVATDLSSQREVWLTRGPLFDAIRASIAIPMVFTPFRLDGRELVDGGLLAPVPIAATRMTHADAVVAVDVNARTSPQPPRPDIDPHPGRPQGDEDGGDARTLGEKFAGLLEGLKDLRPKGAVQSGLMDLMSRSLDTMQAQIARMQLALDPPDVLVRVPRDACQFYEFWRARELIELGREAAAKALDDAERDDGS